MEKWEKALQEFIKRWQFNNEVVGAVVCGSYITGNPSRHSDIDVHILLNSNTSWRERGNEIIDGFLIEYFANPIKKHYEYAEEDYKVRKKVNAHMFATGKILFDKTEEVNTLVRDMKKYLSKEIPEQDTIQKELAKYSLWDMCDNLEEVFENDQEDFFFVYYNNLHTLFEIYSRFHQFEAIPVHQVRRLLINDTEKRKYYVNNFPDKPFVTLFLHAIDVGNKNQMMALYRDLTNHVLNKMGGFDINGWKIRSPS